jgi:hypothetical protein
MFAAGGTVLICLAFYGLLILRFEIFFIDILLLAGFLLVGWQLRKNIRGYRNKLDKDPARVLPRNATRPAFPATTIAVPRRTAQR